MALILAINPGNSHSPTLARLARELKGCELVGAESCKVAITAINQRVPDVVLLPDRTPRGEAELLARLRAVPGGVPTLQLPPVASADPAVLAKEIRKLLAGEAAAAPVPAPPAKPVSAPRTVATAKPVSAPKPVAAAKPAGPSPHVLAAAKAAVTWIRLQRAQWAELDALEVAFEPAFAPETDRYGEAGSAFAPAEDTNRSGALREAQAVPSDLRDTAGSHEPAFAQDADRFGALRQAQGVPSESRDEAGSHERNEHQERYDPAEPYDAERQSLFAEGDAPRVTRRRTANWLPRAAMIAAVAVVGVAGAWLWPQMSGNATNTAEPVGAPSDARVDTSAPAPTADAPPPGEPAGAELDAASKTSGWISVSAPFAVSVTSANEAILLDDRGRGMLAPGKHRLRFQNSELGYDEARVVEVRPTATTTINLTPQTAINVTSNEPGEVVIDGKNAGKTPFDGLMPIGSHTVTVRTAGGERQFRIDATMKPVRLEADFSKPQP